MLHKRICLFIPFQPAGVLQKAAATAVSGVSLARFTGAPSIVVNAAGGVASTALTAINKRLGQTMVGTVAQTAVTVSVCYS